MLGRCQPQIMASSRDSRVLCTRTQDMCHIGDATRGSMWEDITPQPRVVGKLQIHEHLSCILRPASTCSQHAPSGNGADTSNDIIGYPVGHMNTTGRRSSFVKRASQITLFA
jgi:hypothetical protein